MQNADKKRETVRFFLFCVGEKEEDGEFLRRRKGKKKKGKFGGRERTRDEGEQETNKQTKKTDLQISLFFPATSPLFSERKKKKKGIEMNHVRLHKLFSQYSSARARAYILSLFDTI